MFATHVHHLFDRIAKRTLGAGFTEESNLAWLDNLGAGLPVMRKAPVYVLRDPANLVIKDWLADEAITGMPLRQVHLPAPMVLLETRIATREANGERGPDDLWIIQATQEAGGIQTLLFTTDVTRPKDFVLYPYVGRMFPNIPKFMLGTFFNADQQSPNHVKVEAENMRKDCTSAAVTVCTVMMLMMAPATQVQSESVAVPKEANRGRSLLKKSRIPNHTILTLPKIVHVAPSGPHGTHASPRTHWRRPHVRRYPSGKVVRIDKILVNAEPGLPPPPLPVTEIVLKSR